MKPIVAIVGRPNVGKSTLFNRLIGKRKAIVFDQPGVTRDVNYADVEEGGRSFTLVDTGGFVKGAAEDIPEAVREQTLLAIEEADVVVLLMDARAGLQPVDEELAGMLREAGKRTVLAVNKVDAASIEAEVADFYSLGESGVIGMAAEGGRNIDALLDGIIAELPEREEPPVEEAGRVRVAIVGRPNVGKSSLLNRLIGKKRAIVSPLAGTTRDPVDTPYDRGDRRYLLIDTAGIRRKSKVSLRIEAYSSMQAIKTIERCDAAVFVIDSTAGVQTQDEKIAGLIADRGRPCVIAVNKWDAVEKETNTMRDCERDLRDRLPFLSYAPVVFLSALSGQRVHKLFDAVDAVVEESGRKVPTSLLNKLMKGIRTPGTYKGRDIKCYYITQTGTSPLTFTLFTSHPEGIKESYRRHLAAQLREAVGAHNVPVRVNFRRSR